MKFRNILLALAAARCMAAAGVTLSLADGGKVGDRAIADIPIKAGSCLTGALRFDIAVSDPHVVSRYVCYFRSGKGWYRGAFEPTEDEMMPNRPYHVELTTADVLEQEGQPEGWGKADLVRLAAYRSSSKPATVTVENFGFEPKAKEVLFIRDANHPGNDSDAKYVESMRKSFAALGIRSLVQEERDLGRPGAFDGVKLAVLAYTPRLSDAACAAIEGFVARGGRLFAAYTTPARVSKLLGIEDAGRYVHPLRDGTSPLVGFAKGPSPLRGQPDFAPQSSWMCRPVRPVAGAKVAAWWRTQDGKVTGLPGVVVSSNGVYVSHVWLGQAEDASLDLFAAAVETVLPGTLDRLAEAKARAAARAEERRRALAAMPGKAGERRLIWCHSAWGMGDGHDWDSSCRFMKEHGFTDLLVNLAWGCCAFYPSKVLPRAETRPQDDALELCKAACRKHGIKMHVWKVCWKHGHWAPKSVSDALAAAKRTMVMRQGGQSDEWNCPSDPRNQQQEIDAMLELALEKGVDGIHFDYIRYSCKETCFCDGCRERFERRIGRRVAQWPQDVTSRGPLAAEWTSFRCGNIDKVVRTVAERVKAARPEVEISAATFHGHEVTPDTIGQDWIAWCRAGWLDFVCPMDYIKNVGQFAACVASQRDALRGTRTRLYPGLALDCHVFQHVNALVPAREIEVVRAAGLDGFTLFQLNKRAERILPELRTGPLRP